MTAENIYRYMVQKYGRKCPYGEYIVDMYLRRGCLKTSVRNGRIVGAILFRKVRLENWNPKNAFDYDERGNCAFVDELCADDKAAIADVERQMRRFLGRGIRHIGMRRRGVHKFFDYKRYINHLLGRT